MLDNLTVVLVRPKYPENIGSIARACLNFGCRDLVLVNPQNFDLEKALPLATAHASHILYEARVLPDLKKALAGHAHVYAATARTGGWRKGLLSAKQAGQEIAAHLASGSGTALVFGPENTGLTNEEIEPADRLVTIPTTPESKSLNMAHAALVLLYECFVNTLSGRFAAPGPPESPPATHEERELLIKTMQKALLTIDFLKQDNPDYWMLPFRRFLGRIGLGRNEFNLLMGVCRQILWMAGKKD